MIVTYVTGAPGSGKSTHVRDNKRRDDIVIDMDDIYFALGADKYTKPEHMRSIAFKIVESIVDNLHADIHRLWFIKCYVKRGELATMKLRHNTQVIQMDTTRDECKRRIGLDTQRPDELKPRMMGLVDEWFNSQ